MPSLHGRSLGIAFPVLLTHFYFNKNLFYSAELPEVAGVTQEVHFMKRWSNYYHFFGRYPSISDMYFCLFALWKLLKHEYLIKVKVLKSVCYYFEHISGPEQALNNKSIFTSSNKGTDYFLQIQISTRCLKKRWMKVSKDSFIIGFSRLRPFLNLSIMFNSMSLVLDL